MRSGLLNYKVMCCDESRFSLLQSDKSIRLGNAYSLFIVLASVVYKPAKMCSQNMESATQPK